MALDERLRRELEHLARPADPSDVYETVIRRRERRLLRRRAGAAAVALIVVAASVAGVVLLSRVIQPPRGRSAIQPVTPVAYTNGRLAYTDGSQIVISNADGSDVRRIASPAPGTPWPIGWSPDGVHIAVAVFGDPTRSLWVMDGDGSHPVQIASGRNVTRPSWHPDGMHLTYVLDANGRTEIHVTTADGTDDRVVHGEDSSGTYDIFSSTFSPDGSQIVFDEGTDTGYDIFLMDADGSNVRRLSATGTDYNPSWSPDGTHIVFTRQEAASESDIFVMDASGGNVARLTNGDADSTNLDAQYSPDGGSITYEAAKNGGVGPIVEMNPDGTDPHVLVQVDVLGFSWEPVTSAEPSPLDEVVNIGLGFPVCGVSSVTGRFGDTNDGTAYVATKGSDLECPAPGDGLQVLAIDVDGDGVADASYGPLECHGVCWAFAAPDVDRDGISEVAVGVGATGGSSLFEMYTTAGGRIQRLGFDCSRCNAGVFDWGGPGGYRSGIYCLPDSSPQDFVMWVAERTDAGDQYALAETDIDVKGGFLVEVQRHDSFVPYDASALPPGGGADFCGSAVTAVPPD